MDGRGGAINHREFPKRGEGFLIVADRAILIKDCEVSPAICKNGR
jgi:hypothetical protein